MFTTVTVTKWWKSWCKGINEKQVISNPLTEDNWKNLQVVPNLRDFQSSRLKDQCSRKACGRKKSRTRGGKLMLLRYSLKPLEYMNYLPLIFWTEHKFSLLLILLQAMLPSLVRHQNVIPLIYAAIKFSQTQRIFFTS